MDEQKQRQARAAVEEALRNNPAIRELEPERGFHSCFEVPVTREEILSRGMEPAPLAGPGGEEEGTGELVEDYRVLIAIMLRAEADGRPGVATGVDLEFFARTPSSPDGEWLSATRVRDPETGEWVQTIAPVAVQHLLHDLCPGWAEVARAEVIRLALAGKAVP